MHDKLGSSLEQKAAAIMAVVDKIAHGDGAKPAGYWGVEDVKAQELDALIKSTPRDDLETVLDRVCSGGSDA